MKKENIRKKIYIATIGEGAAELASQYGLGLELDHFCMAEALDGEKKRKALLQAELDIQKAGISKQLYQKCGCSGTAMRTVESKKLIMHATFNELFPAAIDPKALELAYSRYEQTYQVAKILHAKRLLVHSGYIPFVYFKSYHIERSVEFWKNFMKDKPRDFSLLIENVLEDEPQMMLELIQQLEDESGEGRFGICLDIGHAACRSTVPVTEWIKTLGPYIRHAHLHNNDGTRDAHGAFDMSKGKLDMDEVFQAFLEYGSQDMTFTVECIEPKSSIKWLEDRGYI